MKWITILFALFILLIIVFADLGMLDILGFVNRIPFGDKFGHFVLYGILTLLLDLSLFRAFPTRRPKLIALTTGLILALLIGFEEISQQFFVNRTFSMADLAASYLGVIIFSWLALKKNK
jgi:VanZ family protein